MNEGPLSLKLQWTQDEAAELSERVEQAGVDSLVWESVVWRVDRQ